MTGRILTRAIPVAAYSGLSRGRGILQVGFSPLDLGWDIALWSKVGLTLNGAGTEVLAWKDQSANGYDFLPPSASARPAYNASDGDWGGPSLTFDGSDDMLKLDDEDALEIGPTDDVAFIALCKGNTSTRVVLAKKISGSIQDWRFGKDSLIEDDSNTAFVRISNVSLTDNAQAFRLTYDDSAGKLTSFIDGAEDQSSTDPNLTGLNKTNGRKPTIGSESNGANFWLGEIVGVFMRIGSDALLTEEERDAMGEWVASEYPDAGIVAV